MGRMGLEPILPVKVPATIGTMLNFDGDCDGDRHGVGTCKHSFSFKPGNPTRVRQIRLRDKVFHIKLTRSLVT